MLLAVATLNSRNRSEIGTVSDDTVHKSIAPEHFISGSYHKHKLHLSLWHAPPT